MIRWIALFVALAGAALATVGSAAEIRLRPDLIDHIKTLREIYPPQGPFSSVGAVGAADVVGRDLQDLQNVLEVTGEIEPGDAERINAALPWGSVVVFDSPGGSFAEGIKIGETLSDRIGLQDVDLLGVYVLDGARCISACALAFASPVDLNHNDSTMRYIERGGVVGFHLPFVDPAKAALRTADGEFDKITFDVLDLLNGLLLGGANPPELLQEMLDRREDPKDLFELNADAKAWRLGFAPVASDGYGAPIGTHLLSSDTVLQLCQAYMSYSRLYISSAESEFQNFYTRGGPQDDITTAIADSYANKTNAAFDLPTGGFYCHLQIYTNRTFTVGVYRGRSACTTPSDDHWCEVPGSIQPAEDGAEALEIQEEPVRAGFFAAALGCEHRAEDLPKVKSRTLGNANLRTAARADAGLVAQLPKSTPVTIVQCTAAPGDNGVWLQVRTSLGDGWVSGKLVELDYSEDVFLDWDKTPPFDTEADAAGAD